MAPVVNPYKKIVNVSRHPAIVSTEGTSNMTDKNTSSTRSTFSTVHKIDANLDPLTPRCNNVPNSSSSFTGITSTGKEFTLEKRTGSNMGDSVPTKKIKCDDIHSKSPSASASSIKNPKVVTPHLRSLPGTASVSSSSFKAQLKKQIAELKKAQSTKPSIKVPKNEESKDAKNHPPKKDRHIEKEEQHRQQLEKKELKAKLQSEQRQRVIQERVERLQNKLEERKEKERSRLEKWKQDHPPKQKPQPEKNDQQKDSFQSDTDKALCGNNGAQSEDTTDVQAMSKNPSLLKDERIDLEEVQIENKLDVLTFTTDSTFDKVGEDSPSSLAVNQSVTTFDSHSPISNVASSLPFQIQPYHGLYTQPIFQHAPTYSIMPMMHPSSTIFPLSSTFPYLAMFPIFHPSYHGVPTSSQGSSFMKPPVVQRPHQILPVLTSSHSLPSQSSFCSTKMAPKKTGKKNAMTIHHDPLQMQSPYNKSHILLPYEIHISKIRGGAFGIEIRFDSQATLVPLDGDSITVKSDNNHKHEGDKGIIPPHQDLDKAIPARTTVNEHSCDLVTTDIERIENSEKQYMQTLSSSKQEDTLSHPHSTVTSFAPLPSDVGPTIGQYAISAEASCERMKATYSITPTADVSHSTITNASISLNQTDQNHQQVQLVEKRKGSKKKRLVFGVMSVVHATVQNNRAKDVYGTKLDHMLQPGDVILDIDGVKVGGLQFHEASALFSKCGLLSQSTDLKIDSDTMRNVSMSNSACTSIDLPEATENEIIFCRLRVAREKKVVKILEQLSSLSVTPHATTSDVEDRVRSNTKSVSRQNDPLFSSSEPPTVQITFNSSYNQVISGDFSGIELRALIDGMKRLQGNPRQNNRMMDDDFSEIKMNPCFQQALLARDLSTIKDKWLFETSRIDDMISTAANKYWEQEWENQKNRQQSVSSDKSKLDVRFLTDVQRSKLRSLPRPTSGCKCGSLTHEYVNYLGCPLYQDIRLLKELDDDEKLTIASNTMKLQRKQILSDIESNSVPSTAIESAYAQRQKLLKEIYEAEDNEAKFVAEMESIQIRKLHKAVFAPRLSLVMVISAVAKLREEIGFLATENECQLSAPSTSARNGNATYLSIDDYSDDDDDDIPLTMFGLKCQDDHEESLNFNQRNRLIDVFQRPSSYVLARLLKYISDVWGHVYVEPDHRHYAWNEECKRGMRNIKSSRSHICSNPREPGSYSYDSLRFILDDNRMTRIREAMRPESSEAREVEMTLMQQEADDLLITQLVSDEKTGLLSDILALLHAGILLTSETGCLLLSSDWISKVHPIILNDLWETGCFTSLDLLAKCLLAPTIRECTKVWKRCDLGWSLTDNSYSDKALIHSHDYYEDRRSSFESMFENYLNEVDGIGQFGV